MTILKTLSDVELKADGDDAGTVTAVFATFDVVDLDGDVTRKGAFTEGAPVVISAYGHTSWNGDLPSGKGTIHETATEAIMRGRFFLDTTHGKDTWGTVKELSEAGLQEWSYSLQDVKWHADQVDDRDVRVLTKIKVKEVSPVLAGAGINTRTLDIKSGDLKFSEHKDAVLTALDELTDRALEVVTLRAEQGKSYTSVTELVELVAGKAAELAARVHDATNPPNQVDVANEFARYVASLSGV